MKMEITPMLITIIVLTFAFAGAAKGVAGFGLPTISLALLTLAIDLPSAMALLVIPSLVTNVWQAGVGGYLKEILQKLWPFLAMVMITTWLGVSALNRVDLNVLSALLGTMIIIYALVSLSGFRLKFNDVQRRRFGPALGAVNGLITGLTGTFVIPGVMYLQALGFNKNQLVQAMGVLFLTCTVALGFGLTGNDLLSGQLGLLSLMAVIPVTIGMAVGIAIRGRLSESLFKQVLFVFLLLLGGYILVESGAQLIA